MSISAKLEKQETSAKAAGSSVPARSNNKGVRATSKYLRFSAQKGRLVVNQIRGKAIADAATTLTFSTRGASKEVFKVLKSAVANAENNNGMTIEDLYVAEAWVDEGPTFKRFKPRARGRADRINKRTCHVTVVVDEMPDEMVQKLSRKRKSGGDRAARVAASKDSAPAPVEKKKKAEAPKPKATEEEVEAVEVADVAEAPVEEAPAVESDHEAVAEAADESGSEE